MSGPIHIDALGYLNDLAKEVDDPWFRMVCDLAAVCGITTLDQPTLDVLLALYTKNASYIGIKSNDTPPAVTTSVPSADFLEELSGFTNFKLLGSTLQMSLKKRVTLIFGATGSGKSSLCEALKVLANQELPTRPLHNIREKVASTPVAFSYKFKSDTEMLTWNQSVGYGPRRDTIKYFDMGIAIKNVKAAVEPGRLIVLTPFKLHVFEWAMELTTKFREAVQQQQQSNSDQLTRALTQIRSDFVNFKGHPLSAIDEKKIAFLAEEIKHGIDFNNEELLTEKQSAIAELEKAASEEGFKLLKAELLELELFLTSLGTFLDSVSGLWRLDPITKTTMLTANQTAQKMLAKAILPEVGTLENFLTLIRAATPLCTLESATSQACPLCKRDLGIPEIELFKQYHDLLENTLEEEITKLKGDIAEAKSFATSAKSVDREVWDKYNTIPGAVLALAKTNSVIIITTSCDVMQNPSEEAKAAFELLKTLSAYWTQQLELKKSAIDTATAGRDNLIQKLAKLREEIEPLEYTKTIHDRLEQLEAANSLAATAAFWGKKIPAFTPLLKKITDTAKKAHGELVVADFEKRLNAEYKNLTERNMAAFGVTLDRKGADAAVVVLPQIGGKALEYVLSEGEQRVHALALFFAELESCTQSVLVFDDPVSSFDYNYISNYCSRLRNFTQANPQKQIIVLTHNWEFFVQIQTTLNQAGLDSDLTVHVLENCSVVAEYSEKTNDLKKDVDAILTADAEPSIAQKEEIAGKMRRLIEAVINTHVFNHQRHQYKQKSQVITAFQSFTKLVPLLPEEATDLRDLYAKLSITEHDDPRNCYTNTDKAMFQTRYDRIKMIEAAIIARKLP